MALTSGARLGPYEVLAPLGQGGMGEVYRARDTKLGRDVALKILPATFAHDPERVARFQREAHLLAALNHPHIAAIHGFEEANGTQFLVLELVEGETLADRLKDSRARGGGLPLDEALAIARQVTDALQAAHEKGIIHRDLKPANIALTADGQVKVLDFGLAKALEADATTDSSNSPTLTLAATQAGVILGTAAYISPEQAKGRAADKRSDVWAFGCVLYELLTGMRAFRGDDASDTLAAVLRGEPDWTALPSNVSPSIRALLRRCLEKDRRQRIADMSAAQFVFSELPSAAPVATSAPAADRNRARPWFAAAAVIAVASTFAVAIPYLRRLPSDQRVISFSIAAPEKTSFPATLIPSVSPDGTRIVFAARGEDGRTQLWMRAVASATTQLLQTIDNATFPFWSTDSRFVAFFADGRLKKIDVTGGPAQSVCDAPAGLGGAWNRDGLIIFAPASTGPLFRVSSTGGVPVALTHINRSRGETLHK